MSTFCQRCESENSLEFSLYKDGKVITGLCFTCANDEAGALNTETNRKIEAFLKIIKRRSI